MKIKKFLVCLSFLTIAFFSIKAQVTIGGLADPDASAVLDLSQVASKNLGLLLPQTDLTGLTDVTTIASPANGLMVYNSGKRGLAEGIYVWYNGQWRSEQSHATGKFMISTNNSHVSTLIGYTSNPTWDFIVFNTTNSPVNIPVNVTGPFSISNVNISISALGGTPITVTANSGLPAGTYEGVLTAGTESTANFSLAVTKKSPTITFNNFVKMDWETAAFNPVVLSSSEGEKTFSVIDGHDVVSAVTNNTQLQISGTVGTATIQVNVSETDDFAASSATAQLIVVSAPDKPGDIQFSTTNPCQGYDNLTYSVDPVNNATGYSWTLPAGWEITSANKNSNSITVTAGVSASAGDISVVARNAFGYSQASILPVTVRHRPGQPSDITPSSSGDPCQDAEVTYQVTRVDNVTYRWIFPNNSWEIKSDDEDSNSITVKVGTANAGDKISVVAVNECGESLKKELAVTVNTKPAQPGAIAASATEVTQGTVTTGLTYNINPVDNATSYIWNLPTGWSITSGNNSNSITVTANTDAISGNIEVVAVNNCGNSDPKTLAVTIKPACEGLVVGSVCWAAADSGNQYRQPEGDAECKKISNAWRLPTDNECKERYNEFGSQGMNASSNISYWTSDLVDSSNPNSSAYHFYFSTGSSLASYNGSIRTDIYIRCVRDLN